MKTNKIIILTFINLLICICTILICTHPSTLSIKNEITSTEISDVSDYIKEEFTPIDINSKKYIDNTITILDTDYKISNDLNNKILEEIKSYSKPLSFYIISLKDGMSIGYNVDKYFETASSIKAPYALYIYKEIEKGNIDKNSKITYEPKFYKTGTGIIKNMEYGTELTIKEIIDLSLMESDNIAHNILHKTYGVSGYNDMLKSLGTEYLYLTPNNPWSFTSSRSAALVWQEIYKFSYESPEGIEFMNILASGKYNYFKEIIPNKLSASKTGFANYDVVETGIVFDDEYPYIAIAIANKGDSTGAYTEVLQLINYMNEIMNEYKEFKSK